MPGKKRLLERRGEDLYTVVEAARMLEMPPSSIRSAIRDGRLAVVEVSPRLNLIPLSEIDRYKRDHRGKRGPKPRRADD